MGDSLEQALDVSPKKTIGLTCEIANHEKQKGQIDYESQIELSAHERLDAISNHLTTKITNRLIELLDLNSEPDATDLFRTVCSTPDNNLEAIPELEHEKKETPRFLRACAFRRDMRAIDNWREKAFVPRYSPKCAVRDNRASKLRYTMINKDQRRTSEHGLLRRLSGCSDHILE